MTRHYQDIPERECARDGLRYFRKIGQQARDTNWGLNQDYRHIVGLCVQLEEQFEIVATLNETIDSMRAEMDAGATAVEELQKQIKGAQMREGKLKKQIENLKAKK